MNNKLTRFFQGLTLTTFSMGVYNTISGIKGRYNSKEQQDILNSMAKDFKENSLQQELWQKSVSDKLDLIKNNNISNDQLDKIEKASNVLNNDITEYKNISNRFSEDVSVDNLSYDETIKNLELIKAKADSIAQGSGKNTLDILNKVLDEINKGSGSGSKYISEVSEFLSSLTFEQTVAIVHITGCIAIIISLISLIIIFYGNILIDRIQLEKRFPRIAIFIK